MELFSRIKYWNQVDRLGPDIPTTHYKLYFKKRGRKLCKIKFKLFDEDAEFRPGAYAIACSKISIGKRVVIRPNTMLFAEPIYEGGYIYIEDDVLIGSGVQIYTTNHNYTNPDILIINQGSTVKDVILKKGCWVGANAIILPGITIGENSVVAAGSIVTKSVPDKVLVAGNPAKIIKELEIKTSR